MKIFAIVLLFSSGCMLLTATWSCSGDDDSNPSDFESEALILGLDEQLCACCGDWLIKIDDQDEINQFVTLPEESTIDLENAEFPLSVRLDWSETTGPCAEHIQISRIEKIE